MFGHFWIIFKFMVSPELCLIHPLLINYLTLANNIGDSFSNTWMGSKKEGKQNWLLF